MVALYDVCYGLFKVLFYPMIELTVDGDGVSFSFSFFIGGYSPHATHSFMKHCGSGVSESACFLADMESLADGGNLKTSFKPTFGTDRPGLDVGARCNIFTLKWDNNGVFTHNITGTFSAGASRTFDRNTLLFGNDYSRAFPGYIDWHRRLGMLAPDLTGF